MLFFIVLASYSLIIEPPSRPEVTVKAIKLDSNLQDCEEVAIGSGLIAYKQKQSDSIKIYNIEKKRYELPAITSNCNYCLAIPNEKTLTYLNTARNLVIYDITTRVERVSRNAYPSVIGLSSDKKNVYLWHYKQSSITIINVDSMEEISISSHARTQINSINSNENNIATFSTNVTRIDRNGKFISRIPDSDALMEPHQVITWCAINRNKTQEIALTRDMSFVALNENYITKLKWPKAYIDSVPIEFNNSIWYIANDCMLHSISNFNQNIDNVNSYNNLSQFISNGKIYADKESHSFFIATKSGDNYIVEIQ